MDSNRLAEIKAWHHNGVWAEETGDRFGPAPSIITELLAEVERLQREADAREEDILYRHGIIYEKGHHNG